MRAKKNLQRENNSHAAKNSQTRPRKKSKSSLETGSFRIIGGQWRSRRLSFPAIEGLRPTTDRVRETVFNWLNADIQGARVLDVFSGSGALGLEALSRGAVSLFALEKDRLAAKALQTNSDILVSGSQDIKAVTIQHSDALSFLADLKIKASAQDLFDLIFLDPPFRKGILDEAINILDKHPSIQKGALIYIEREKELPSISIPSDWILLKEKVAGQVLYQLFRVQ
jgi:16S rRNA (guanine966-N2)-methyltransferase